MEDLSEIFPGAANKSSQNNMKLFEEKVYSRPWPGTDKWEVVKSTPFKAFWHDLFWYGPFVAFSNLIVDLFGATNAN
jgi:hypothetical protein